MAEHYLKAFTPDKAELEALGKKVRERLDADRSVYKVPVERAEVYACGNFLDEAECDRLMEMIDTVAKPSTLFEETYQDAYRTSYSGNITREDSFVKMIERRICDLLGIEMSWGEAVQGQRYYPGQEYKQHCDFFYTDSKYWKSEKERGGQRSWTAMAFLNNVEEGGQTRFPHLGIKIAPQRGALLIWNNARPDGVPNDNTLHAALPVEKGVKYVITKWFRTRPWH